MALGYVRPAREDEVDEITRIQLSTWRTAYSRILPPGIVDRLDAAAVADRWRQAVTAPPSPHHHVLVALEQAADTHLVGFAAVGPADETAAAPDEPADALDGRTAAVTDLLIEPRWARRGHGSRLLAAAVDLWRADGSTRALAWAFERDPALTGLLTSAGWEPDGAVRALDMDGTLVRQHRLHVDLGVEE
jgi:GNAT superfamily N-acetyltransferase